MSTGESLPMSPVFVAASLTRLSESSLGSWTRRSPSQRSGLSSPYFLSSLMTPGGQQDSPSGSWDMEKSAELSRTCMPS
ncbi:hypothetical protein AUQ37_00890 [Candidatus Methanomethylophilus sp. 1R26]|jgi:hypothetical protein|nr:hypothetical protein AUQ37_00890 [Candidatus Methanomethylophilus sp. 1R26]TQS76745.1 MAG: hypothetical protein A3Q59_02390 [Methanomethylophilus alvi]